MWSIATVKYSKSRWFIFIYLSIIFANARTGFRTSDEYGFTANTVCKDAKFVPRKSFAVGLTVRGPGGTKTHAREPERPSVRHRSATTKTNGMNTTENRALTKQHARGVHRRGRSGRRFIIIFFFLFSSQNGQVYLWAARLDARHDRRARPPRQRTERSRSRLHSCVSSGYRDRRAPRHTPRGRRLPVRYTRTAPNGEIVFPRERET
jgi:hypothetical protein